MKYALRLIARFAVAALIFTFGSIPVGYAAGVDGFVYTGVTGDILRFLDRNPSYGLRAQR